MHGLVVVWLVAEVIGPEVVAQAEGTQELRAGGVGDVPDPKRHGVFVHSEGVWYALEDYGDIAVERVALDSRGDGVAMGVIAIAAELDATQRDSPDQRGVGRIGEIENPNACLDARVSVGYALASHESVVAVDVNARQRRLSFLGKGGAYQLQDRSAVRLSWDGTARTAGRGRYRGSDAAGGPSRRHVYGQIIGEPGRTRAIGVHHVDLAGAASGGDKGDLGPVGRLAGKTIDDRFRIVG